MPRGGDRRQLEPPAGRDLHYASLLFEALWDQPDFRREYVDLYRRWIRWLKAVLRTRGLGLFGELKDVAHDLENLERWHRPEHQHYPKPRPLTPEEQECMEWRSDVVMEILTDGTLYSLPFDDREAVDIQLAAWQEEPWVLANGHCKRKDPVRLRSIVRKYQSAVQETCSKAWRLDAWWAVPAVIQHHFEMAQLGVTPNTFYHADAPLSLYAYDLGDRVTYPLVVRMPDVTDQEFERDKERLINLSLTIPLGDLSVKRTRFTRDERAAAEEAMDAACLVFDWDGHDEHWSQLSKVQRATVRMRIVEEWSKRTGYLPNESGKRKIMKQLDPQILQIREHLKSQGWTPYEKEPLVEDVAKWIAVRLLKPSYGWANILPMADENKARSEFRAVRRFADRAKLNLPAN